MRALALVATFVAIAACSGKGPQSVGAQPSWRHGGGSGPAAAAVQQQVTFAPQGKAVARYNEGVTAPAPTELGDAVLAAVREAAVTARTPQPVADQRLFRACNELAAIVPEEGIISYGLVEFALHRNGIIEPSPHLLVVWGDVGSPQAIVESLSPKLVEILAEGAHARVGIGAVKRKPDGTGAVVFALQGSWVKTRPIPRVLPARGAFTVEATLDPRYHDPELFVTRDSGATERLPIAQKGSSFTAQVACGASTGKQQVEITASDAQGSTVLANFPVWCGTEPPETMTVEVARDDVPPSDPVEAERRLLAMLNRDRQVAHLPALVWDERVADVARRHSADMRATKIVAHISPTTGSAADRVRAGKIKTAVVLENVARAYGLAEAHEGLMNSPGHRANILSHAATHVGVGVVLGEEISGRREVFVTQVFTRVPPKIEPARATEALLQKLVAIQQVGNSARLVGIAQQLAEQVAAGKTRDQAYPAVKPQVDALSNTYQRVGSVITATSDLDALDGKSLLGDAKVDDVGIGIAQGAHPELGENAIWVVVLLAQKR
ncbi:MAG: CAP domain-containing protein [Deltaproteobacteria bacterium]|nr:CAP domain-containing protein [Deltaproteobacteria bacterium]